MKVFNLKKIYPSAIVADSPTSDKRYFNYFDGTNYLHIEKIKLTKQELALLVSINRNVLVSSIWYDFLVKDGLSIPQNINQVQCIHFHVEKISSNHDQWLLGFKSYFENLIDAFFTSENKGVIIIDKYEGGSEKLQGFTYMLDDDFSTSTSIYIGIKTSIENSQKVFKEEENLFYNNLKGGKTISYLDAYIPVYVAPQLDDSVIAQQIKASITNDRDLIKLITRLWDNQGNLSATAIDLFMHRNTLNYRIDKLLSEHNLNLRDMQQLLLCYLLVI